MNLRALYDDEGYNGTINFVISNMPKSRDAVDKLTDRAGNLPVVQDAERGERPGLTVALDAGKDDMFFFSAEGKLVHYEQGGYHVESEPHEIQARLKECGADVTVRAKPAPEDLSLADLRLLLGLLALALF